MVSRRDLLFGAVRRLRDVSGVKPVSGIGVDISAADAAYVKKDYATARDLYKDVLKENRSHKDARIRLGLSQYHLGEYMQAKDTLLLVFKQYPQDYLTCLYLGLAYARRDRIDKCMEIWKGFISREHIGVMREINIQRALFETGEELTGEQIASAVEGALQAQTPPC